MDLLSECGDQGREIITVDPAPKPSKRAQALAEATVDGEGLGPEVIERIARSMDKALEEGRRVTEPELVAIAHFDHFDGAYSHGPVPEELRDKAINLCSFAAAQALLAQRDDRIAELESKLGRWRAIARAAVVREKAKREARWGNTPNPDIANASLVLSAAVHALPEEERAELLEEE